MPNVRFTKWLQEKALPVLLYATLVAGILVRIVVWWQNRSLFLDEANLALNFCEKDLWGLFGPLAHDQYAPPLFSVLQKCSVLVLGQTEMALRFFPLLAGILAIWLFYRIGRRLITNPWVLLVLCWIFCFSDLFIRYATEGKQYGVDLAVALVIVAWSLRQTDRPFRPWMAALAGGVLIWFSMPAVFVLFGAGLALGYQAWRDGDRRRFWLLGMTAFTWLLSFGAYYLVQLKPSLGTGALVEYHKPWFFPLAPVNHAEWQQLAALLRSFPYYTAGHTVLALAAGGLGILAGVVWLSWQQPARAFLLAIPVLVCIVASGLEQYSMIPRMLTWAFPLVLLIQGLGWQYLWNITWRPLRIAWLIFWVAAAATRTGWTYLYQPFQIEEVRAVLEAVRSDFGPDDLVYISHEAGPAVAFYRTCHAQSGRYAFDHQTMQADWDTRPEQHAFGQAERVWLVYSHVISDLSRQAMEQDVEMVSEFAVLKKAVEVPGARGYLFLLEE
ncbi:MAG: hypothetical protein EP344_19155 [Bacteroidetes bacterium]|nr:MAG: hypothetical protein EP344_19155 [Bacteroidota bacterium]